MLQPCRSRKLHRQFDIKPYVHIQVLLFPVLTVFLQLFGDISFKKWLPMRKGSEKNLRDELVNSPKASIDIFIEKEFRNGSSSNNLKCSEVYLASYLAQKTFIE